MFFFIFISCLLDLVLIMCEKFFCVGQLLLGALRIKRVPQRTLQNQWQITWQHCYNCKAKQNCTFDIFVFLTNLDESFIEQLNKKLSG